MLHFKKYYFNIFIIKITLKVIFYLKENSRKENSKKLNYFSMFSSVIKNKLENTFQYLVGYVMEKKLKNNFLMF